MKALLIWLGLRSRCCGARIENYQDDFSFIYDRRYCTSCDADV